MRYLAILGAGTAGTMLANKLRRRLPRADWHISVVDQDEDHLYQPGLVALPFTDRAPDRLVRARGETLRGGIDLRLAVIQRVIPMARLVQLEGDMLSYDALVIATGSHPRPDRTPGLDLSDARIHTFHTLEGALALRGALERFRGGRLVVHIAGLPIKGPMAPLEFAFRVDAWLRRRGLRAATELTFVTPQAGAVGSPVAAVRFAEMLRSRDIALETDVATERVTADRLVGYDGREVPFDLLVSTPAHTGAAYVGRSGLGDALDHVPVDQHTFRAVGLDDVFAIGDAADLPTSKTGSAARYSVDVLAATFVDQFDHLRPRRLYDGHTTCFVATGSGRSTLVDYNYDTEPLPGSFPVPRLGPLRLLRETRVNHAGRATAERLYWSAMLQARPLPIPTAMRRAGKHRPYGASWG
jgi:sulfide:quinone oxidoreductase